MAKEVPLYKDKKYVKLLEKVLGRLKTGFENKAFYTRASDKGGFKQMPLDSETYNRAVNALFAQPNQAFRKTLEKFQDSNVAELAHKIRQAEDGLLRKFQAVLGMEAHHVLPQNVMGWLQDLPISKALEALHQYRKQGGTTGVVPENIKIGSQMGHRAWKGMSLLKDSANEAMKGIKNYVSAHVNPFTLLDEPKFFQGGFDRKVGNIFKQNQRFTPDDPIQFIVDTIKDQAGEPGKLFAKALDSPFETKAQEYFNDLLGTDIFKLAESGKDPGLVKKYNKALKTLNLNYNVIFKDLAQGKKPPAWNDEILDVIDGFNDSVKSGKSWSENALTDKLSKIKPDKWYRNPIVGRTPAGRMVRGAIPVLGIGADTVHAAGSIKKAVQEPSVDNYLRAGSSVVNFVDQTGLIDMGVHWGTDPNRNKAPEKLLSTIKQGERLTTVKGDDTIVESMLSREQGTGAVWDEENKKWQEYTIPRI